MKDILVAYLTWKNSINSPNTLKKYTGSVEIYCDMVFGKKPDELTRDDFENLLMIGGRKPVTLVMG